MQSNQYPRALDIARPFRAAGIPVAIGGFHVSGCLSMLDGTRRRSRTAPRDMGISMFAGEAEGRLDDVLRDAAAGPAEAALQLHERPAGDRGHADALPARSEFVKRTAGTSTSFDAGRGCPYQCSFCTIINVQGRKSRFRSPDDVEQIVRDNWAQGITRFFITDDNFARNKEWEAIFDRLIELREVDRIPLGLMIQVDTLCHKIPNFMEKAKRAGVTRVFIGLENINPDNLAAAKKRQNKITEYRKMLLAWKAQGIITMPAISSASPPTRRRRSGATSRSSSTNLPLDMLEFFFLTPLPGSEDHQIALEERRRHGSRSQQVRPRARRHRPSEDEREEWQAIYQEAWSLYYTPEHMETLLRRAVVTGIPLLSLIKVLVQFTTMMQLEKVHPLQSGLFRLKHIAERRPGLPAEIHARLLSALRLDLDRQQPQAHLDHLVDAQAQAPHRARSRPASLHGSGAHASCATTTSRRSISSPRPTAGGPPSRTREKSTNSPTLRQGDRSGFAAGRLSSPARGRQSRH